MGAMLPEPRTKTMSQSYQPFPAAERARAQSPVDRRARFIVRTYNHLFGAIVLFAAIEFAFFATGIAPLMARAMLGTSWLLVLGGFMVVSWLASRTAHTASSMLAQY